MSDRPFDQEEADQQFAKILERDFWIPLSKSVPHWDEMNDNVRAALLDLNYNEGYNFGDGDHDSLDRCLKEKCWQSDIHGFNKILLRYRNPGQPDELGLARRRYGAGLMATGISPEMARKAAWAKMKLSDIVG